MNWKTFFALLGRDAHVARRNIIPVLLQTFLQPLMFVFIFGRVMVSSGYMPAAYKSLLACPASWPSAWSHRVWAVPMPLTLKFSSPARSKTDCSRPWKFPGCRGKSIFWHHASFYWPAWSSSRQRGCY